MAIRHRFATSGNGRPLTGRRGATGSNSTSFDGPCDCKARDRSLVGVIFTAVDAGTGDDLFEWLAEFHECGDCGRQWRNVPPPDVRWTYASKPRRGGSHPRRNVRWNPPRSPDGDPCPVPLRPGRWPLEMIDSLPPIYDWAALATLAAQAKDVAIGLRHARHGADESLGFEVVIEAIDPAEKKRNPYGIPFGAVFVRLRTDGRGGKVGEGGVNYDRQLIRRPRQRGCADLRSHAAVDTIDCLLDHIIRQTCLQTLCEVRPSELPERPAHDYRSWLYQCFEGAEPVSSEITDELERAADSLARMAENHKSPPPDDADADLPEDLSKQARLIATALLRLPAKKWLAFSTIGAVKGAFRYSQAEPPTDAAIEKALKRLRVALFDSNLNVEIQANMRRARLERLSGSSPPDN